MDTKKATAAPVAVAYCFAYIAYLFVHAEGEIAHWGSIVIAPTLLLAYVLGRGEHMLAFRPVWMIAGIRRAGLERALMFGAFFGGSLTVLQLFGRNGVAARMLFTTLGGWGWLISGLILMSVTAAATEEYFFRGLLQGSLSNTKAPRWVSAAIATTLFVVYHVPYAYGNPKWASHGNMRAAIGAAVGNALLIGVLLSVAYEISRRHLLAPWLAHALTNMVPGALFLQRHFGRGRA